MKKKYNIYQRYKKKKYKCPNCDFISEIEDEVRQHSWYCGKKEEGGG